MNGPRLKLTYEEWREAHKWASAYVSEIPIDGLDGPLHPATQALAEQLGAVGYDLNYWWLLTHVGWACPACGRTKDQIARINRYGELFGHLVEHHDHMAQALEDRFVTLATDKEWPNADELGKQFAERSVGMVAAFENAIICQDCNNADVDAKKAAGTPPRFSFSPAELGRITRPRKNQPHKIDADVAVEIWRSQERSFAMRVRIINWICEIALSDEHWYQRTPGDYRPKGVVARAGNLLFGAGFPSTVFSTHDYVDLFKAKPRGPDPATAWRRRKFLQADHPPGSREIRLVAEVNSSQFWNLVAEGWVCPCCTRTKVQCIQPSNRQPWLFIVRNRRNSAGDVVAVCGECNMILTGLAQEANIDSADVCFSDLRPCVDITPNASHRPRSGPEVDAVIGELRRRGRPRATWTSEL